MIIENDDVDGITLTLRWRWVFIVGSVVAGVIVLLTLFILDLEKKAWQDNNNYQGSILTKQLASELHFPMMSGSQEEVEIIINSFLHNITNATAVSLQWPAVLDLHFGDNRSVPNLTHKTLQAERAIRVDESTLWYAIVIRYKGIELGNVAIRFSETSWNERASKIKIRLGIAAAMITLLASIVIYWVAGRMSRPIELLAEAEKHVAKGNFSVRLPVKGNDEISAAMRQFNSMTEQLAHKEKVRDAFGKYLNPELISKLFSDHAMVPGSHSQEVTVLFADMVDFTGCSEHSKAEHVVDIINEHFEVFYHIINAFGGHVDKYIGDAVMAVFNHPFEDENHIEHAVLAGVAMFEACKKLAIPHPNGGKVQFRIGIDFGDVIVGNIGARQRLEYTVIGNTVNVASRMAGLGVGVIMSEKLYQGLDYGFKMDDIIEQKIKGLKKPIRCGSVSAESKKVREKITSAIASSFEAKEKNEHSDDHDLDA